MTTHTQGEWEYSPLTYYIIAKDAPDGEKGVVRMNVHPDTSGIVTEHVWMGSHPAGNGHHIVALHNATLPGGSIHDARTDLEDLATMIKAGGDDGDPDSGASYEELLERALKVVELVTADLGELLNAESAS